MSKLRDVDPEKNLATVVGLVEGANRALTEPQVARRASSISLLGGRGAGKSTLLHLIMERLRETGYVVLPVAEPEVFTSGDTVLAWALAGIERTLSREDLTVSETKPNALTRLVELQRNATLTSGAFTQSLSQRGLSAAEYARDAAMLAPLSVRQIEGWIDLLSALPFPDPTRRLVVLPVDDLDLSTHKIPGLLAELEMLAASPQFLAIFAADEDALIQSLALGGANEYPKWDVALRGGLVTRAELQDIASRKFAKYAPRHLRVRVREVEASDRLDFAPIEAPDQTLAELLDHFRCENVGMRTLRDLFVVRSSAGVAVAANEYTLALSGNRRDLQQICANLSQLHAAGADSSEALAAILEHGIDSVRTSIPANLRDTLRVVRGQHEARSLLDFSDLTFGRHIGPGPIVRALAGEPEEAMRPLIGLGFRRISEFYIAAKEARPVGAPEDRPEGVIDRVRALNPMFSHLVLLAYEAQELEAESGRPLMPLEGYLGDYVPPGLWSWRGAITSTDGETPYAYYLVPAWERYSDYYSYVYGWNRMVDALARWSRAGKISAEHLEWMAVTHIELVLQVHATRMVPEQLIAESDADADGALPDAWADELGHRLAGVRSMIARLLPDHGVPLENQRQADLAHWVGIGLAMLSSRNAVSERVSEGLRSIWDEFSRDDFSTPVAEYLGAQVSGYIGSDRAAADIALLGFVDPRRGAEFAMIRSAIAEQRSYQRHQLRAALAEAGVPEDLLLELERAGAQIGVVSRLRVLGVGSRELAAIVDAYPAVGDTASESGADAPV